MHDTRGAMWIQQIPWEAGPQEVISDTDSLISGTDTLTHLVKVQQQQVHPRHARHNGAMEKVPNRLDVRREAR